MGPEEQRSHGLFRQTSPSAADCRLVAAPTVGDVHGGHVAEHVVLSGIGGNVLGRSPDYRAELDFPVVAVAAVRNDHRFRIADHGSLAGFHE